MVNRMANLAYTDDITVYKHSGLICGLGTYYNWGNGGTRKAWLISPDGANPINNGEWKSVFIIGEAIPHSLLSNDRPIIHPCSMVIHPHMYSPANATGNNQMWYQMALYRTSDLGSTLYDAMSTPGFTFRWEYPSYCNIYPYKIGTYDGNAEAYTVLNGYNIEAQLIYNFNIAKYGSSYIRYSMNGNARTWTSGGLEYINQSIILPERGYTDLATDTSYTPVLRMAFWVYMSQASYRQNLKTEVLEVM